MMKSTEKEREDQGYGHKMRLARVFEKALGTDRRSLGRWEGGMDRRTDGPMDASQKQKKEGTTGQWSQKMKCKDGEPL